ncbi:thiamine-phosphate kinase [Compostibacter hankyongensis]|uniref:Thiamine-monophosphate kinase n=1 Tax=Compostibacter hankyongensis TaxID=1007089 RepID=A0ABP8FTJ3_9BACT
MAERTEIEELGEFGLIDYLTRNITLQNAGTLLGVGDDAAVIDHFGRQTVLTTDLLIEGVHFDLAYTPLKHLGYKSVVVNLSDVYAMNARPSQFLLSIAFSNRFPLEALHEFYEGVYHACENYQTDLIGGDTSSSRKGLIISGTAVGEVAPDRFIRRSTARPGDLICVSGDLGAAYLGLQLLEREKKIHQEHPGVQPDLENQTYLLQRLLRPEARRDIIAFFEEQELVPTAMQDVSDGLSSDLLHICRQSNVGCLLYEEKIPIHDQSRNMALKFGLDPTACALHGGEDYELLFTIRQEDHEKVTLSEQISVVGYLTEPAEGTYLYSKGGKKHALTAQGWNAFRS